VGDLTLFGNNQKPLLQYREHRLVKARSSKEFRLRLPGRMCFGQQIPRQFCRSNKGMVPIWKSHAAILPDTPSILKVCITLALTCCWKRQRRRSGRCKQSGAVRGSARMYAWTSGLPSAAVWEPHDTWSSSPLARGDDPTYCDGHASWDGLVTSQFLRTLLARHAPPLPVSLRSAVVYGATRWTAAQ
jgi:hypothetical protein